MIFRTILIILYVINIKILLLCVIPVEMDYDGSEYSILFGIRQVPCDE